MDQKECFERLKLLNGMIQDYLDRMELDDADEGEDGESGGKDEKKGGK
jgi:hypothetical protein